MRLASLAVLLIACTEPSLETVDTDVWDADAYGEHLYWLTRRDVVELHHRSGGGDETWLSQPVDDSLSQWIMARPDGVLVGERPPTEGSCLRLRWFRNDGSSEEITHEALCDAFPALQLPDGFLFGHISEPATFRFDLEKRVVERWSDRPIGWLEQFHGDIYATIAGDGLVVDLVRMEGSPAVPHMIAHDIAPRDALTITDDYIYWADNGWDETPTVIMRVRRDGSAKPELVLESNAQPSGAPLQVRGMFFVPELWLHQNSPWLLSNGGLQRLYANGALGEPRPVMLDGYMAPYRGRLAGVTLERELVLQPL